MFDDHQHTARHLAVSWLMPTTAVAIAYPDTDDNARWHASACQQYEVYNHIPGEEGDDPVHFFWGTATWLPEEGWVQHNVHL